jgi:hypothetical protein
LRDGAAPSARSWPMCEPHRIAVTNAGGALIVIG